MIALPHGHKPFSICCVLRHAFIWSNEVCDEREKAQVCCAIMCCIGNVAVFAVQLLFVFVFVGRYTVCLPAVNLMLAWLNLSELTARCMQPGHSPCNNCTIQGSENLMPKMASPFAIGWFEAVLQAAVTCVVGWKALPDAQSV